MDEAAKILDLTQHLERKPANLSGGQRQRVAMGRAIVRSPKAFLMDEPLSNLDAKLRVQMRTSVSKLQKQLATTTVYVTHDQTEAMTLGDRVVVLRGGVVQQIGSPQFLYDNPTNLFVAGFIGSPSMNFLPGTLENGRLSTGLGAVQLSDRIRQLAETAKAPREVIAGVRPEHFEDARLVDAGVKADGTTFSATVDVLESMGSDKYAYFTVEGDAATSAELDELAADARIRRHAGERHAAGDPAVGGVGGEGGREGRRVVRPGQGSAVRPVVGQEPDVLGVVTGAVPDRRAAGGPAGPPAARSFPPRKCPGRGAGFGSKTCG